MAVELAPELLEILACPNCHGALAVDHDRDELVCTAPDCGLAYPVRDGIPVLLIDEARRPQRQTAAPAAGQAPTGTDSPGTPPPAAAAPERGSEPAQDSDAASGDGPGDGH